MKGKFLCGCNPGDKQRHTTFIVSNGLQTFQSFKRYDEQGFEVCPEHGHRLYGWASAAPVNKTTTGGAIKSTAPDLRDNRDPETIGREILMKHNGHN